MKLPRKRKIRNPTTTLMPVIVFIHGGLFMFGGSNEYRPHYMMDENVVLVTLNYRLASFGFLNTGDGVISGNMGLKDQVMALEWIRDNIQFFGGDKDLVTIAGESAGGASAHYHMLSPMSKGLFHRGILMSGTALNHWAFNSKPKEQAQSFGKRLGCPTNPSTRLARCLKSLPAAKINEIHEDHLLNLVLHDRLTIFAPTKETVRTSTKSMNSTSQIFLSETPSSIVESIGALNKVPIINGVNEHEGLIFVLGIIKDAGAVSEINERWTTWAPSLFDYEDITESHVQLNISHHVKKFYFGENTIGRHTLYEASDLFSDTGFYEGLSRTTLHNYNKSMDSYDSFLYFNSHKGSFGVAQIFFHRSGYLPDLLDSAYSVGSRWIKRAWFGWKEHFYGVCHGDEIGLLFRIEFVSNILRGDDDYHMSKALVKTWVEFAKNGRPSKFNGLEWPAAHVQNGKLHQLMQISERPSIIDAPFSERLTLWNSIRKKALGSE